MLARSHDRAQNDNRPYHFCAKNEYIDGQFLADGCGNRQRQVADGAFFGSSVDIFGHGHLPVTAGVSWN